MATSSTRLKTTSTDKNKVVNLSKNCDLMVTEVKQLLESKKQLTDEELDWMSVVYKQSVNRRRDSWSSVRNTLDKEEEAGNAENVERAKTLLKEIENEIRFYCNDILQILENKILPTASSNNVKVFCYKLLGDHNRYLAEIQIGEVRNKLLDNVLNAYKTGYDLAVEKLDASCPEYLALALNYSLFVYEILENHKKAIELTIIVRNDVASHIHPKSLNKKALDVLKVMDENILKWGGLYMMTEPDKPGAPKPYHVPF